MKDFRQFVESVTEMQRATVAAWHEQDIENTYDDLLNTVCQQHTFNFRLWHEEDKARCTEATDAEIATVKRNIDGLNQQRNDWIEKIDDALSNELAELGIEPAAEAQLNTETPGSVMDRLSILSLRIYHVIEQVERNDVSDKQRQSVVQKLVLCHAQHADLSQSLAELLEDIFAGRKQHRTYRQMKMYNDPSLNPYLYKTKPRMAG
jgi:hypothetical protein